MTDQPKSSRLLRLIVLLLGPRNYSIEELARQLETTERTIYRYIDTFRSQGFLIQREGSYFKIDKNGPNWKQISDLLHFTPEESWILNNAILMLDDDVMIKQNLAAKLYSIYQLKSIPYPVIRKEQSEKISGLIKAVENTETVWLRNYSSAHSNRVSDRKAEPFEFTLNYGFIWCYEHESGKNKLFKTARIGKVEPTGEQWQFEPYHRSEPTDMFRITGKETVNVKLKLSLRAASLLCEEYPLAEKAVSPAADGHSHFEGDVYSFEGIGRFILGLPDDVEVLGPDSLKLYLNKKIRNKIF
jgi:predicted DNA-binding transcriptional regulator YafY